MNHVDEKTIELYVLDSGQMKSHRPAIAKHLKHCKGCAALHEEIAEYYAGVDDLQRAQAKNQVQALYAPERAVRTSTLQDEASI